MLTLVFIYVNFDLAEERLITVTCGIGMLTLSYVILIWKLDFHSAPDILNVIQWSLQITN